MVALFVKEISSQLVSTTSFIFYLNMVTLFIKEVSSQLISTTSVLSVLLGGIYNGQWLPVSKNKCKNYFFWQFEDTLLNLPIPLPVLASTTWKQKNLLQVYGSLLAAVASLLDRSSISLSYIYHFTFHMSWITKCCAVICRHNCRVFVFRSGHLLGLPCVDHLHYLLSVANVFLARGEDETKMWNGGGMYLLIMKYETKYETKKRNNIWQ